MGDGDVPKELMARFASVFASEAVAKSGFRVIERMPRSGRVCPDILSLLAASELLTYDWIQRGGDRHYAEKEIGKEVDRRMAAMARMPGQPRPTDEFRYLANVLAELRTCRLKLAVFEAGNTMLAEHEEGT